MSLTPPELDWQDGVPKAKSFDDVYYSKDNGLEESRYVFLTANHLPDRLAEHQKPEPFCVGETGFGTGLNFLCLWQAWRRLPAPRPHLHFISLEGFPLSVEALEAAHAPFEEVADLAAQLRQAYPAAAPGVHRRLFEGGAVTLDLHFGTASEVLTRMSAEIDCWFLDGFAPAKNPDLWNAEVLSRIGALTKESGTFATFTAVGQVKRDLIAAGFDVSKVAGFGRKRDMLTGTKLPSPTSINKASAGKLPRHATRGQERFRDVIILGAGMAGTNLAYALKQAGAQPVLVERLETAGAATSGNPVGLMKPLLQPELSPTAQLFAACYSYAHEFYREHAEAVGFDPTGAIDLPASEKEALRFEKIANCGLWPEAWARWVSDQTASDLFGQKLSKGGLHYPGAGALSPPRLCEHLAGDVDARYGQDYQISRRDNLWHLETGSGETLTAPALVLANGIDVSLLEETQWLADVLHPVRGQVSVIEECDEVGEIKLPLHEAGYVLPARDGGHVIGATFQPRDTDLQTRQEDDLENKTMLSAVVDGIEDPSVSVLSSRAGLRVKTRDHLPVVGAVPELTAFKGYFGNQRLSETGPFDPDSWQVPGLYVFTALGSRGLLAAPLLAQYLTSLITGGALPLPADAIAAITPTRFPYRALRRDQWPVAWG